MGLRNQRGSKPAATAQYPNFLGTSMTCDYDVLLPDDVLSYYISHIPALHTNFANRGSAILALTNHESRNWGRGHWNWNIYILYQWSKNAWEYTSFQLATTLAKSPKTRVTRALREQGIFHIWEKEGNRAFWDLYNSSYTLAKNQKLLVSGRMFIRLNNSGVLISVRPNRIFYFLIFSCEP